MFPIFKASQIKEIDSYTIQNEPIASIDLMERAVLEFYLKLLGRKQDKFLVFAGPGNNGGDALGIARRLHEAGREVSVFLYKCGHALSPDCETNKQRLINISPDLLHVVDNEFFLPEIHENVAIIDGLFGNGLNRPLTGEYAEVVRCINRMPNTVFAVDIPSGLMAEDNGGNIKENIVHANFTFTFQYPKLAFFFAENQQFVGEWSILDIGLMKSEDTVSKFSFLDLSDAASRLKKKSKFAHKGSEGHALIFAGKTGMAGAALLAAKACLRAGVGKVSVATQEQNRVVLQTALPEVILYLADLRNMNDGLLCYQTIGVGPGIGTSSDVAEQLQHIFCNYGNPMVVDADAINVIAVQRDLIQHIPPMSVLTPHKLELRRLIGSTNDEYDELMGAISFARAHNLIIVLKGAFSKIIMPDGTVVVNPTGNPGMATAGSGDVLTGVITAFLAQGYEPREAAVLGVFVHGLAGDKAADCVGQYSLIASDIIQYLPEAFKTLESYDRNSLLPF